MKKITKLMLTLALLTAGVGGVKAQDETDITTLPWVQKGQDCTKDFNNVNGGTVYGTDTGGANLSYVDVSAYGTIKLYGTGGQEARLFINREEAGDDNGTFRVKLDSLGVATFDCNTVLTKQPLAQYIHLNGVKASAWNTTLNLSSITVSGSAITFPEPFILPDGEVEINTLPWVNQGQGLTNNLGFDTGNTIYGTDAGPADGKLSYIDATDYNAVKLYGEDGTVRLFINRAEYASATFQFNVTITDGVGTLNLADVYDKQEGATYIHINGVKATYGGTAKVNHITLVEKPFEFPEGVTDLTTLPYVNEGQGCVNNLGTSTDATIYGTDAGPSDGNLSYIDVTNYDAVKLYGAPGDVVRLFINRAEYESGTFQFFVTIGQDGVGTLNLADVYAKQNGATYVHINGFKAAQTWASTPDADGKALVKHIGVVNIVYTVAGTENLTGYNWDVTENPMTLNKETGKYEITFENVAINANEDYKFKVVMDGNWDSSWPDNDWEINTSVTGGEGNYNITIKFDPSNNNITVACEKVMIPFTASFETNLGWEHIYAYAWTGEGNDKVEPLGTWNEKKYELTDDNNDGVYELNFMAESAPTNIIFHNGEGEQTNNLDFVDGKAYSYDLNYYVMSQDFFGSWNASEAGKMTKNQDGTYTLTMEGKELSADQEYKVMKDLGGVTTWYPDGDNRVIGISMAGTYDIAISFNPADNSITEAMSIYKNISGAGYATWCVPYDLNFEGTGVKAYIAKNDGTTVTFEEVTSAPANTGLLLKGAENSYKIPMEASTTNVEGNILVGVPEETQIAAPIYVLMDGTAGVGFYKTTQTFTVSAHTAYIPAQSNSRSFIALDFDNMTTAIEGIADAKTHNGEVYNLQGQRVVKAQKGLYIINGKKVVIK